MKARFTDEELEEALQSSRKTADATSNILRKSDVLVTPPLKKAGYQHPGASSGASYGDSA
ncbi:hypothetical protein PF005_g6519 [Phytophthora fragariae]|nr:hypothetical protein PF003_g24180 [Phytophthora fragariae]KAE9035716.1 hypothetical protein PR002_g7434 [Phytophthora rubi]KAE9019981.1 hypothetical protein PF011_g5609 [Phytophthora fragariae]KAE9040489.1 hypothetical protein PR001_g7047 [Phytophthora rubi]KAE9125326.1 hypothetical protein PF007_g6395 [Phytophthora fragariae]